MIDLLRYNRQVTKSPELRVNDFAIDLGIDR